MKPPTSDIVFSAAVKAAQARRGSRKTYSKVEQRGGWSDEITPELEAFIGERDSFYLGTASANARPYIQHRGGPRGFLKVLDRNTLAFADFTGNRQYISLGNLDENDKAFIFLMDYPNRRRVKVWGTAEYVEGDPELEVRLNDEAYGGRVERAIVFHVEAWDINCPQHITPRFTVTELAPRVDELVARVKELETELERLRAGFEVVA